MAGFSTLDFTPTLSLTLPLFKLKGLQQININTRRWSSLIMSWKSSKPKGFNFFSFSFYTAGNKTFSSLENDVFTSFYFRYFPQISFLFHYYPLFILLSPYGYMDIYMEIYSIYSCLLSLCFSIFSIYNPLIFLSLFLWLRQCCWVSVGLSESDLAIDC